MVPELVPLHPFDRLTQGVAAHLRAHVSPGAFAIRSLPPCLAQACCICFGEPQPDPRALVWRSASAIIAWLFSRTWARPGGHGHFSLANTLQRSQRGRWCVGRLALGRLGTLKVGWACCFDRYPEVFGGRKSSGTQGGRSQEVVIDVSATT